MSDEPHTVDALTGRRPGRVPPQAFFGVSAVFHYLGPSLAVLLFARLDVLGVAWLRVASAAVVFALWRRPWRSVRTLGRGSRRTLLAMGAVLAVMNTTFYLAVDRLPLSTVGAIEFLGTVILAAAGARTPRNALALILTTAGVAAITAVRITGAAARVRLRLRELRAVHGVHRARPPDRERGRPRRDRPARGGHARRGGDRDAVGPGRRAARVRPSGAAAGRGGGRRVLVGDPLRHRPAGHGPAGPRHVLPHAGAAAGVRHRHRRDRAAPAANRPGRGGDHPGRARRRRCTGNKHKRKE